jgi:hypothetical protein
MGLRRKLQTQPLTQELVEQLPPFVRKHLLMLIQETSESKKL